jgi:hypothetical protein
MSMKQSVTPSGNEPATFRPVAQRHNQLRRLLTVPEKMHLLGKRPERQAGKSHSTATVNLFYAIQRHDAVTDIS